MEKYDVIIVGAGIGGLKLAELLNNSKLKVLLVEKRPTIKKLVNHIYGTYWETVKKWKLDKYIVQKCGWGMYATEKKTFKKLKKRPLCILEMDSWAKSLKLQCKIKTDTMIKGLKREDGLIVLTDQTKNKYSAKIVVDCSGDAQVISSLLGISKSKCDMIEYIYVLKNVNIKKLDEMCFFNDSELLNCGGWYYPLSKDSCFIGVTEWTGIPYLSKKEQKKRLDKFMKEFYPFNKYFKNPKIVEEMYKLGPITTIHSSIVEDNYLAVGDASGASTPLIGDGFRVAFDMAESAHKSILKAFELNDFSKKIFKEHINTTYDTYVKWYKWSYLFRFMYLRYMNTNEILNLFTERIDKFSEDDYYDLVTSKISFRLLIKLFTPKIAFLTLKNFFVYHLLKPIGFGDLPKRPLILKK